MDVRHSSKSQSTHVQIVSHRVVTEPMSDLRNHTTTNTVTHFASGARFSATEYDDKLKNSFVCPVANTFEICD